MGIWQPFRPRTSPQRTSPQRTSPQRTSSPPRAAVPRPPWDGGWRALPPQATIVRRMAAGVSDGLRFRAGLASWQNPSFASEPGHAVLPSAPTGFVHGVLGPIQRSERFSGGPLLLAVPSQGIADESIVERPVVGARSTGEPVIDRASATTTVAAPAAVAIAASAGVAAAAPAAPAPTRAAPAMVATTAPATAMTTVVGASGSDPVSSGSVSPAVVRPILAPPVTTQPAGDGLVAARPSAQGTDVARVVVSPARHGDPAQRAVQLSLPAGEQPPQAPMVFDGGTPPDRGPAVGRGAVAGDGTVAHDPVGEPSVQRRQRTGIGAPLPTMPVTAVVAAPARPARSNPPPRTPAHQSRTPAHEPRTPAHEPRTPTYRPQAGEYQRHAGDHQPRAGTNPPRAGTYPLRAEAHQPQVGAHQPRAGAYSPRAETRPVQPGIDSRPPSVPRVAIGARPPTSRPPTKPLIAQRSLRVRTGTAEGFTTAAPVRTTGRLVALPHWQRRHQPQPSTSDSPTDVPPNTVAHGRPAQRSVANRRSPNPPTSSTSAPGRPLADVPSTGVLAGARLTAVSPTGVPARSRSADVSSTSVPSPRAPVVARSAGVSPTVARSADVSPTGARSAGGSPTDVRGTIAGPSSDVSPLPRGVFVAARPSIPPATPVAARPGIPAAATPPATTPPAAATTPRLVPWQSDTTVQRRQPTPTTGTPPRRPPVQRRSDPAPATDTKTEPEPENVPDQPPLDLDALARRLIEPVARLLRTELRRGRERAGRPHDGHR